MGESYSDDGTTGAARAEPGQCAELALASELMTRLVAGADVPLLVAALLAERTAPPRDPSLPELRDAELPAPERELRRVRTQLALGAAARSVQHAMNNPLTALLAEAQLLELEPLADEHRLAVSRIVELARRVATVTRRMGLSDGRTV